MAKNSRNEPQPVASSRSTLIVMAVGGILVTGLIAWAMTRTVEPAPAAIPAPGNPVASSPMATATTTVPLTTDTVPGTLTAAPVPAADKAVARISVEDLRAQVGRGAVTVIDVRDAGSFAMAHIPGALSMPMASIEGQIDLIPKDKPIVTYCT